MKDFIEPILIENKCEPMAIASGYKDLLDIMEDIKADDVIEIGTYNGLSTAVLAKFCKRVFTFDLVSRNGEYLWNLLGVRKNIFPFVGNQEMIEWEIDYVPKEWKLRDTELNINLAFLDGGHHYNEVKHDFEMVKFCGRVLIHDYKKVADIHRFCDEIGARELKGNFALWEAE